MNYNELIEQRKHGDGIMPIANYSYSPPYGIIPMHYHWHTELEFFKVISGKLRIQCNEGNFEVGPGALLFFNSGVLHGADNLQKEGVSFQSIVFHPEMLSDMDIIRAKYVDLLIGGNLVFDRELQHDAIIPQYFDTLFETLCNREFGYELEVKALLFAMFARLMKICRREEKSVVESDAFNSIKMATQYICNNYSSSISVDELAYLCRLSPGYFYRLFKRSTLKTPVQYINNVRISKASELLLFSNRKIVDIAMETGFNSESYFIDIFKKAMGITPAQYRNKYKQ